MSIHVIECSWYSWGRGWVQFAFWKPRPQDNDTPANNNVQPRPYAAIELIHQQPVKWTHDRIVSCDGGGGPLGHPRVFINTDKPQICWCEYCGNPFVRCLWVHRSVVNRYGPI